MALVPDLALLRLALERSTDASEAVSTIVELIERHGQGGGCGLECDAPAFKAVEHDPAKLQFGEMRRLDDGDLPGKVSVKGEGGAQVILPRKGVLELARLLMDEDEAPLSF